MTPTAYVYRETKVPSRSHPGREYRMVFTRRGWEHADEPCEWWMFKGARVGTKPCEHQKEAERKAMTNSTDVVVHQGGSVALEEFSVEKLATDFDASLIVSKTAADVIDKWVYSFKGTDGTAVTDLSIKGVQAVTREMAKKGEVIRPDKIEVVYEDDDEIRFMATATRVILRIIEGVPVYIELDRCTRAKRQDKKMMVGIWEGQYPNRHKVGEQQVVDKFYYEKGVSKAYRNAMAPLLGGEARAQILQGWTQAQKVLGNTRAILPPARPANAQLSAPAPAAPQRPPQTRQTAPQGQQQAPAPQATPSAPAMPAVGVLKNLIQKKLQDITSSWDFNSQQQLGMEMLLKWPDTRPVGQGKTANLAKLDQQQAYDLNRWLDSKLGGGPPPEEPPPADPTDPEPEGEAAGEDGARREEIVEELVGCDHPSAALTQNGDGTFNCGKCGVQLGTAAEEEE